MVDSWRVMTAISRSFTRSVMPGIVDLRLQVSRSTCGVTDMGM